MNGGQSCGKAANDSDGVVRERLETMKRTRSGLIGNVTRIQGELDVLMLERSQYEPACTKKNDLDDAILKCMEHASSYLQAIPDDDDYQTARLEAQSKSKEMLQRKAA